MLYLAQVHKNDFLDQYQLRLLARQESENFWLTIADSDSVVLAIETLILLGKANAISNNLLVLVELSPTGEIQRVEDATPWVINLVQTYLSTGITPKFLKQEAEKVESWQQNLTLQNQDLARRSLELEARREQIEALEESIKRERNGREKTEG
jgi:predicted ATPase with chaperone activity